MVKNERLYRQPNQFQYYFFDTSYISAPAALQQLQLQVGYGFVHHTAALLATQFSDLLLEVLPAGFKLFACFGYSAFLDVGDEDVAGFSISLKLFLLD